MANQLEESSADMVGQLPVVLIRHNNERQLHFTQNLKVLFSSGAIQVGLDILQLCIKTHVVGYNHTGLLCHREQTPVSSDKTQNFIEFEFNNANFIPVHLKLILNISKMALLHFEVQIFF